MKTLYVIGRQGLINLSIIKNVDGGNGSRFM